MPCDLDDGPARAPCRAHYYVSLLDPASQKMLPLGQVVPAGAAAFDLPRDLVGRRSVAGNHLRTRKLARAGNLQIAHAVNQVAPSRPLSSTPRRTRRPGGPGPRCRASASHRGEG